MSDPFAYVNSILETKKNLMDEDYKEKEYLPFLVNRSLSQFSDTIMFANEMNINYHLDGKLQYEWYLHSVKKMKRQFRKWPKKQLNADIDAIIELYQCSYPEALDYLRVLTPEQIKKIHHQVRKGGS